MKFTIEITQGDIRKNYSEILGAAEFLTVPDNPFGRAGPSSIPMAYLLKNRYNVRVAGTINTRDRNRVGIVSEILAAMEMNIDGIFVVSGDSFPKSKEVRELDVFQVISLIKKYRHEYGSEIQIGATINPSRQNELKYVKKKIESGADFFITQTIYDASIIKNNRWIKYIAFPVFAGFMPILSKRMINFYSRHLNIPPEIQKNLTDSPDLINENLKILSSIISKTYDYVEGYHIMPLGNLEFMKRAERMVKK